jgi:hypothetical protein
MTTVHGQLHLEEDDLAAVQRSPLAGTVDAEYP